MTRHLSLLPALMIILLIVGFFFGLMYHRSTLPSPLLQSELPDIELASYESNDIKKAIHTRTLIGKPMLLNVFTTWCVGCLEEHAFLGELNEMKLIDVVGLNLKGDTSDLKSWLARYGNPYKHILMDQEGNATVELGITGTPETYLIDAEGMIRYKHVGPLTVEVFLKEMLPILMQGTAQEQPLSAH